MTSVARVGAAAGARDRRLCWLPPLRHSVGLGRRIDMVAGAADSLVASWRWIALGAVAGLGPLVVSWTVGFPGHGIVTALLVFPGFVALVRQDRQRAGYGLVLVAFGLHSMVAIVLASASPAAAAPILTDGEAYWERNHQWLVTGHDPEYQLSNWLPAHFQHLGSMVLYAFSSLGLIPLVQGLHEIDLMNFYVGRLLAESRSGFVAFVFGWHAWAILRCLGYTRIVFEVTSLSLERMTGRAISSADRRRRRWMFGLTFLVLDGVLKHTAMEPVRSVLHQNLLSP